MAKQSRTPSELRSMFGANLRLLSGRYPSISELSRQLGINRTQFNRYLSGESFPRPDVLDRICAFFEVDARVLLEPVESLSTGGSVLNGPFLANYIGLGVNDIPEDFFPSGFYRFSRRSFVLNTQFIVGIVHIFRKGTHTFVRGFEPREAMRKQGLPLDSHARQYRGYVARQEDGVTMFMSRYNSMTCSFNYLSRVASFQNNFWLGYVTRTVPEANTGTRAVRMAYEHLGRDAKSALPAARAAGFCTEEELEPFHRRLLRPDDPSFS